MLDEALNAYQRDTWDVAYGASGTVGAVGEVLAAAGWPPGRIDRAGLDWLLECLLNAQSADRLRLDGMRDDRKAVIGGGISVLLAVFDLLEIDQLQVADGALRHGVLYDLLDRDAPQTDVRSASVQALASKFRVDEAQAGRVASVARHFLHPLLEGAAASPVDVQRTARKLCWAAQLHEIGMQISHSDYHKHGTYILDHADVGGFAVSELHRLALLVLGHRGKLRKLEADFTDPLFVLQLLALRLAVMQCHARRNPALDSLAVECHPGQQLVRLTCDRTWALAYPQSSHLLREEVVAWQKTPWQFAFCQRD